MLSAGVTATVLTYLHACPICSGDRLHHYCRVPSRFDPGLFIRYERCGNCGIVFRNPRLGDQSRLDAYEDCFYERMGLTLLDRRGNPVESDAYVVPERHRDVLSDEPWTLEWFREHAMADYLARLFS